MIHAFIASMVIQSISMIIILLLLPPHAPRTHNTHTLRTHKYIHTYTLLWYHAPFSDISEGDEHTHVHTKTHHAQTHTHIPMAATKAYNVFVCVFVV